MRDLKRPLRIAIGLAACCCSPPFSMAPSLPPGSAACSLRGWPSPIRPTPKSIWATGELVVKEGAAAKIEIRLSGEVPKTAKLALQTGEGRPREIELAVVNGLCTYEIASASRDFTYRVKAGDARSDWRQVRVIPAPRLAEGESEPGVSRTTSIAPTKRSKPSPSPCRRKPRCSWQLTLDSPTPQSDAPPRRGRGPAARNRCRRPHPHSYRDRHPPRAATASRGSKTAMASISTARAISSRSPPTKRRASS